MSRIAENWRSLLVALLGFGLGALALSQTVEMSELGRVFPTTAGLIAIAAAFGVLVQVVLNKTAQVQISENVDIKRVVLLSGTLLLWALLLEPLGFELTSSVAIVAVALISRRQAMPPLSILIHAIAGVFLVGGFSLLLSEVLNVRLP